MSSEYVLVIAEKPGVAHTLAKVLGAYKRGDGYLEGGGYLVSWCIGHLVGLAEPEKYGEQYRRWTYESLPVFPDSWMYVVSQDKRRQFEILKKLMQREDVGSLVEATDAGREGELIFRLAYQTAGCTRPFQRLWISSLEDASIRKGFEQLRDGKEYDLLYEAASCRMQADWLVGINATRLFSVLYGKLLSIGRVQTPTLAMLTERADQIACFRPEPYYEVELAASNGMVMKSKRYTSRKDAEAVCGDCEGNSAVVLSVEKSDKREGCPLLYDLTSLQRESNRIYGYTARQTLDAAQSLYEKKLITYPRTDSRYLTEDMVKTAEAVWRYSVLVLKLQEDQLREPQFHQLIQPDKVKDHHAILPTMQLADCQLDSLPKEEQDLMKLICIRLICAAAQPYRYLKLKAELDCSGSRFYVNGVQELVLGWKQILQMTGMDRQDEDMEPICSVELQEGEIIPIERAVVTDHQTSPPRAYTDDTLLAAMEKAGKEDFEKDTEKKGIGTPATRAAIIETLVNRHYAQRKGKQIIPTRDGINLISVLPDTLKSAGKTAEWENRLLAIEQGRDSTEAFLSDIRMEIQKLVESYPFLGESRQMDREKKEVPERIGVCPRCHQQILEGRASYYCRNQECRFRLYKEDRYLKSLNASMTKQTAKTLLKHGKVWMSGLLSQRTGKKFDAYLVMDTKPDGTVFYRLDFKEGEADEGRKYGTGNDMEGTKGKD